MQPAELANYYTMRTYHTGTDELDGPRHHRRALGL
jgi:hypothetical protein